MYRDIRSKFDDGVLRPASRLDEVPHIGPYLYDRLRRQYCGRSRNITIRQFSRAVQHLSTAELKETLQRALQNERANQCAGPRGRRYHVRDVNEKGFEAMVALLRVLKNNADGYQLGANMTATPQNIPYPAFRSEDAKYAPCKSRRICRVPNVWRNGVCQYRDRTGFEGIGSYPGQQIETRDARTMARRVRRAQGLERSASDRRRDASTRRDVASGHGGMRYSIVTPSRRQRVPSRIVRLPLRPSS